MSRILGISTLGWMKGKEMLNRLILHELGAIERFDCKRTKLLFPEHPHV
jgi:hypothetical protein